MVCPSALPDEPVSSSAVVKPAGPAAGADRTGHSLRRVHPVLVLFLGVVRNQRVPYFIRFNALQAILLDIILIVLSLAFNLLLAPLGGNFAVRTLANTVFLGMLVLVLFGIIQCLRGKEADIPSLSEAVRMQL